MTYLIGMSSFPIGRLLMAWGLLLSASHCLAQEKKEESQSVEHVKLEAVEIRGSANSQKNTDRTYFSNLAPSDKILDRLSGVALIKRGNYAWEPVIRGLQAAQISMSIDGMHMIGACTDRMDPISSYLEPSNLESIQIDKGTDQSWTGNGLGPSLNFQLKRAHLSKLPSQHFSLGTTYESNGHTRLHLGQWSLSRRKWGIQVNAVYRQAKNYEAAKDFEIPFSQYKKWNLNLAATWAQRAGVNWEMTYLWDQGRDIGYPALPMDVGLADAQLIAVTRTDSKKSLTSKVYFNRILHDMDDSHRPPEQVPIPMDMPGRSQTWGAWTSWKLLHIDAFYNRLTANMTMYPNVGNPMFMYTIPDAARTQASLQLRKQYAWHEAFHSKLQISLGVTHSTIYSSTGRRQLSAIIGEGSSTRIHPIYRAAWHSEWQQPKSNWFVFGGLNWSKRSPSLQELYGFYLFNQGDAHDYLGNPNLRGESAIQVELGFRHQTDLVDLQGSLFQSYLSDHIVGKVQSAYSVMTIGALGVKQYQSATHALLRGAEFQIKMGRIGDDNAIGLRSDISYTWGEDAEGWPLPQISPFRSLNTLYMGFWNLQWRAEWEYNHKQHRVNTLKYGETPTPASHVFHLHVHRNMRLSDWHLQLGLHGENLFDANYNHHLDLMKIPRPGRSIGLSLRVQREVIKHK